MADEVVSWVDADGGVTVLPVEWKARGRFMPKVLISADAVPGQPGEVPREARHGPREVLLPLSWASADEAALWIELRQIVAKMDPVGEDGVTPRFGKIRVQTVLGDVRELTCLYLSGLEMDETIDDSSGPNWQKMPVSFLAHDPYWYAASATSKTFVTDTPSPFFPIFPLVLSASSVAVADTLTNDGDRSTWPVWTIRGPGTEIRLSNLSTGEYIYLGSHTLGLGESLTIDTRKNVKTLTLQDGTNKFDWLSLDSTLWAVRKGLTTIQLQMSGTTASSGLTVSYTPRYLSP